MGLSDDVEVSEDELAEIAVRLGGYFGRRFRGSPVLVDELVAETMARLVDPERANWDPGRGSLVTFAIAVVGRGVMRDVRRAWERRRLEVYGPPVDVVVEHAEPGVIAIERAIDERRRLERLLEMASEDAAVRAVLLVYGGEASPDSWNALGPSSRCATRGGACGG